MASSKFITCKFSQHDYSLTQNYAQTGKINHGFFFLKLEKNVLTKVRFHHHQKQFQLHVEVFELNIFSVMFVGDSHLYNQKLYDLSSNVFQITRFTPYVLVLIDH